MVLFQTDIQTVSTAVTAVFVAGYGLFKALRALVALFQPKK